MEKKWTAGKITYISKNKTNGLYFYDICILDMDGWYNHLLFSDTKTRSIKKEYGVEKTENLLGKLVLLDVTESFGSGILPVYMKTSPRYSPYHSDNTLYSFINSEELWQVGDRGY